MFDELIASVTDVNVLVKSVTEYFTNLSVSKVVMSILVIFMIVGVVDKLRGNKHGYGEKFDDGFNAMGTLALAIVGIVALTPVLLTLLKPIIIPICSALGASPAMFPGLFLAFDMGAYTMATQLAGTDPAVGNFSGLIVSNMMGMTLSFTIPYALTMIKKKDQPILAMGILVGIIAIPVGCLVGGLAMNLTSTPMSIGSLLVNSLPVIIMAALVAVGLIFFQKGMLKGFVGFGKGITFIVMVSPAIAVFQYLTGIRLPLFSKMVEPNEVTGIIPLEQGLLLIGSIAIVLIGAFPMIHFINRKFSKVFINVGNKLGINNDASTALVSQLANSIPMWSMIGKMNDRGKLFNIAFTVSGSFVFGDSLGFVGSVNPEMTLPVIAAKLCAGAAAITLAVILPLSKSIEGRIPENVSSMQLLPQNADAAPEMSALIQRKHR